MNFRPLRIVLAIAALFLALLLAWALATAPKHPVALIRVVDASGIPVAGARIHPDGLRTKPGPYESGHYGWMRNTNGPGHVEVTTDSQGRATVPYPKYVFEKIETGQISFAVSHPEFVPDRPFRVVTTAPPKGAPFKEWLAFLSDRVKQRTVIARTEPVVLQRGALLQLSLRGNGAGPSPVYAQISNGGHAEGFWTNPAPTTVLSRQIQPGPQLVRLIQFDSAGLPWFSDVIETAVSTNQPAELSLDVKRGVALSGRLDPTVPRPIKRGRVIAHVTPPGKQLQDNPPQWHAWTETTDDGSFRFDSLPSGTLEIYALCDGYVSTNGPGQFTMHYPQRHTLQTNDLQIIIGMEPTARLEVTVFDDAGKPLKDAFVTTWPNIRYGEWSAVLLGGDCYNSADHLRKTSSAKHSWGAPNPDVTGSSDERGLAVLLSVPANVRDIAVQHPDFQLPAVDDGLGRKSREAKIKLIPGQTNRISLRLEPRETSQIAHY